MTEQTETGDTASNRQLEQHRHLLQQNGLLAILTGLIGGFVLVASLIGGLSASPVPYFLPFDVPGTPKGWLGFHLGMLMNGMMALLIERILASRQVTLARSLAIMSGVVVAVWGNCAFYLFTMFAPNRGLTSDANVFGPPSLAGYLAYFPALIGAIGLIVAVVLLMLSSPSRRL